MKTLYTHAAVAADGRIDHLLSSAAAEPGYTVAALQTPLSGWPLPPHAAAELHWVDGALAWHDPRTTTQRSADARTCRDALLAATDWRVTRAMEAGQALPAPWVAYRQALRDVPEQPNFPGDITWPTPPET